MKRVERLRIFQRAIEDIERRRAATLAASERRLSACTTKLAELEAYCDTYARQLSQCAAAAIDAARRRDYETFLGQLAQAVRQQTTFVARARTGHDADRLSWQDAAQRAEVVGRLVSRWKNEEYGLGSVCGQRESVDRARRRCLRAGAAHGA
jgi:flagellar export protein FliJ